MILFYDNEGKTVDRYTMAVKAGEKYDIYDFSEDALSPQGINAFNGSYIHFKKDKPIDFDDLPLEVRKACVKRLVSGDDFEEVLVKGERQYRYCEQAKGRVLMEWMGDHWFCLHD